VTGVSAAGVNEVCLEVAALDRAESFYAGILGLPVVERWDDAVWVLAGTTRIGLWLPRIGIAGGRGGVHVHFAFHVEEADYDSAVTRLREHGLDVEEVRFSDARGRSAYVTDPDGHCVELWTWDVREHLA
jgi:catechol 2,3-dioxygenase-like lactoylglutathione lyase family enzyme